jgi:hypothetical protein
MRGQALLQDLYAEHSSSTGGFVFLCVEVALTLCVVCVQRTEKERKRKKKSRRGLKDSTIVKDRTSFKDIKRVE